MAAIPATGQIIQARTYTNSDECIICHSAFEHTDPPFTHTQINSFPTSMYDLYHLRCLQQCYRTAQQTAPNGRCMCPYCQRELDPDPLLSRIRRIWRRVGPSLIDAGYAAAIGAMAAGAATGLAGAVVGTAIAAGIHDPIIVGAGMAAIGTRTAVIGATLAAVETLILTPGAFDPLAARIRPFIPIRVTPAQVGGAVVAPAAATLTALSIGAALSPVLIGATVVFPAAAAIIAHEVAELIPEDLEENGVAANIPARIAAAVPVTNHPGIAAVPAAIAAVGAVAPIPIAAPIAPRLAARRIAAALGALTGVTLVITQTALTAIGVGGYPIGTGGALGAIAGGSIMTVAAALALDHRQVDTTSRQNIALGLGLGGLTTFITATATDFCTFPIALTIITAVGAATTGLLSRIRRTI